MDVRARVNEIVKKETGIDLATFDPKVSLREQGTLDSMMFVEVFAALVDELQIAIPTEVMDVDTLDELYPIIEKAYAENAQ